MSYCRWSSDNHRCDIYAYEHVDGFYSINVAGRRRIGEIPPIDHSSTEALIRTSILQNEALDKTTLVDIGLPHDGETFEEPTLQDFKKRLLMLRDAGYNFPDYVLEEIDNEINNTPPDEGERR